MDSFCKLVLDAVLDQKAINTVVIDISKVSVMADFMIICTGRSKVHTQGIANNTVERVKNESQKIYNIDGASEGNWVLLDLGNVIVHIMVDETRKFYTLEKLWGHGKVIYLDESNITETQNV